MAAVYVLCAFLALLTEYLLVASHAPADVAATAANLTIQLRDAGMGCPACSQT